MKQHTNRTSAASALLPSLLICLASTIAFNATAACATESQAGERKTISLDGTWQVAEGTLDQMPQAFAHTVPVPGLLDMATPEFETPGNVISNAERGEPWRRPEKVDPLREAFWYRRTFTVNAPKSNVALLKVNRAFFGTCVFLNGKKVGTNAFNFTPGWFDLKPHIKTDGTENELVIRVGASLAQIPLSVTDGWDPEKVRYVPGIYDSVTLIVTSTPHVVNVQTVPDLKNGSVRAVIELANTSEQEIAPTVRAVVQEAKSGRVVGQSVVEPKSFRPVTIAETTNLRPGGKGRVDTTVKIADPHWWSPEDPFLYELIVDTGADSYKTRFAMRSFKTDPASGRVLLNGKPYYLRGSNVCVFRYSEDPLRGDTMWDRQWVRKLHRQFKSMHWNSLRYCIGFPPEMWYEIADEEGILIQDEFPIWYNHWPHGSMHGWPDQITADSLASEFRQWMRERWNHPCVVIWDAQNETNNDTVLAEVIGRVRGLDLSNRPWDNGWGSTQSSTDVSEYHPYRCSPQFPRPFSLSIFKQESGVPDTGPKQRGHPPYIINEYGWLWLNRDGTPTWISRPVYDSVLGPDAAVEQYRDFYARTLAAMTEFWRSRRKCAGVMHFCGLGHSRPNGVTCDNFLDLTTLEFDPFFYKYVRDSFAPVSVILDLWQEQVEPSAQLSVPVMVVNDLDKPFDGAVTLHLRHDGKNAWQQTKQIAVEPLATGVTQFQVSFPDRPAECELIAEIRGHDGQPVRSYRLLEVRVSGEAHGGLLRNGGLESGLTGTDKARMILFEPLDKECGPGGRIDHWTTWGPGVLYYSAHGLSIEDRAVKFWHSDSGMFQEFDVTAGQDYAFRVEVLNSTINKEVLKRWKGYLRAEFYDDSSKLIASADLDTYDPETTDTPLEQWETLLGNVAAPVGATRGRIVLGLKDYQPGVSGVLHFDNARVVEVFGNDDVNVETRNLECGDLSPLSFTKNLSETDTLVVLENGMETESGDKSPHSKIWLRQRPAVVSDPKPLTPLMQRELRGCFDFFWNEWISDPARPTYGMTCGDYVGMRSYSPIPVESQGFYFAAIVIGVERGWITREEGEERILITMNSLRKLERINGFWYHFIDPESGKRGWKNSPGVELSNASSGTMILGALAAGEYFGGEVKRLAEELYADMNWKWFTNPVSKHPYLACYPQQRPKKVPAGITDEGMFGAWSAYSEHIFLYILAAGAPNPDFATAADSYYAMRTFKGRYKGEEFIFCGTGAAFTYQWTHAFIDFRNLRDKLGRNWFDNSRHAALAARQYAIDNADRIKGLGPNSWGMSACISPSTGYSGRYGSHPIGAGHKLLEDGTVAPYGALSFLPFTPKESTAALEHMYQIPGLVGDYGLYDAYSYVTKAKGDQPWIAKSYLGIDKGLVLLMFENHSTQLIWRLLHQNTHIQKGLKRLEFVHVKQDSSKSLCRFRKTRPYASISRAGAKFDEQDYPPYYEPQTSLRTSQRSQ